MVSFQRFLKVLLFYSFIPFIFLYSSFVNADALAASKSFQVSSLSSDSTGAVNLRLAGFAANDPMVEVKVASSARFGRILLTAGRFLFPPSPMGVFIAGGLIFAGYLYDWNKQRIDKALAFGSNSEYAKGLPAQSPYSSNFSYPTNVQDFNVNEPTQVDAYLSSHSDLVNSDIASDGGAGCDVNSCTKDEIISGQILSTLSTSHTPSVPSDYLPDGGYIKKLKTVGYTKKQWSGNNSQTVVSSGMANVYQAYDWQGNPINRPVLIDTSVDDGSWNDYAQTVQPATGSELDNLVQNHQELLQGALIQDPVTHNMYLSQNAVTPEIAAVLNKYYGVNVQPTVPSAPLESVSVNGQPVDVSQFNNQQTANNQSSNQSPNQQSSNPLDNSSGVVSVSDSATHSGLATTNQTLNNISSKLDSLKVDIPTDYAREDTAQRTATAVEGLRDDLSKPSSKYANPQSISDAFNNFYARLNQSPFFNVVISASGECQPVPVDIPFLNYQGSFSSHCDLFSSAAPVLSPFLIVAWSFIALRIFLSA